MRHRDEVILTKILSEISIAQEMLGVLSLAEFEANELLKRAICMTVINIGELVKNLSDECHEKCPAVPWRAIAGFRDIAAHKYQTLKMADVYETVKTAFPNLYMKISQLLEDKR